MRLRLDPENLIRVMPAEGSVTDKIQVHINDKLLSFSSPLSLAELLNQLKINLPHIAVAVNGEIVPRSGIGEVKVNDGDKIEAIRAVAGG